MIYDNLRLVIASKNKRNNIFGENLKTYELKDIILGWNEQEENKLSKRINSSHKIPLSIKTNIPLTNKLFIINTKVIGQIENLSTLLNNARNNKYNIVLYNYNNSIDYNTYDRIYYIPENRISISLPISSYIKYFKERFDNIKNNDIIHLKTSGDNLSFQTNIRTINISENITIESLLSIINSVLNT